MSPWTIAASTALLAMLKGAHSAHRNWQISRLPEDERADAIVARDERSHRFWSRAPFYLLVPLAVAILFVAWTIFARHA